MVDGNNSITLSILDKGLMIKLEVIIMLKEKNAKFFQYVKRVII